nr:MAG TPA: hypothetical protein [Caudoviricetes sp.]DAY13560.1 MAG TPA: hypothetical protein [Caudoviricetes sp.]
MKNANIDFSGVVSVSKIVHGVEVRGLNFADVSAQWQTNGTRLMDAYDEIVAAGANTEDVMNLANTFIKHAPDLARAAFLAAINDDGAVHAIQKPNTPEGSQDPNDYLQLTAGEIWDTRMSIGKQADFIMAIIELTMAESDTLKKSLMKFMQKSQAPNTLAQQVRLNITK